MSVIVNDEADKKQKRQHAMNYKRRDAPGSRTVAAGVCGATARRSPAAPRVREAPRVNWMVAV